MKGNVMSKTEVVDAEEPSVSGREITLDRTFSYEGKHFGPGTVTIQEKDQERTDLIYKSLKRKMKQLIRLGEGPPGQRLDRSTTGVVNKGTDPTVDQPSAEPEGQTFTFNEEEVPAADLFNKTDAQLKEGGMKKSSIRRLRELQETPAKEA